MSRHLSHLNACVVALALMFGFARVMVAEAPLPIANLDRSEPVDFNTEILPVLRRNCIPCHRDQEPEGGLVLESRESILVGGDTGPAVESENALASLLITRATGKEDSIMPPEDNSVGAKTLTPDELGLLKLWIEQGAKQSKDIANSSMHWRLIPESIRSINALDVAADGNTVAFGRGNRVVVWDLNGRTETARLVDGVLDERLGLGAVADVDIIQSIAFSPNGDRIVTGGFRTARIWRKTHAPATTNEIVSRASGPMAVSQDEKILALVNAVGELEIWNATAKTHVIPDFADPVAHLDWGLQTEVLYVVDRLGRLTVWSASDGQQLAAIDTGAGVQKMAVSADGKSAIIVAGGKAEVLRFQAANEGRPATIQREKQAVGGVADVTDIVWLQKSSGTVLLATKQGAVKFVDVKTNKVARTVQHGGSVNVVAVLSDGSKLLTGGLDGITKIWSAADGKLLATISESVSGRIAAERNQRDLQRQKNRIASLDKKSKELETRLKNEDDLIVKETAARDAKSKELAVQDKAVAEAVAKGAASEKELSQAVADLAKADAAVLKPEAAENAENKADADDAVGEEDAAGDEDAAGAADAAVAEGVAEGVAEDVAKKKVDIEQLKKLAAEAKTREAKTRKAHETTQQAVQAATEKQTKLKTELSQREKAIATAKLARQRVAASIAPHKVETDLASRELKTLEQVAAARRQSATESRQAVVEIAISRDETEIATLHRDGSVRITRVADGVSLAEMRFAQASQTEAGAMFLDDRLVCFGNDSAGQTLLRHPRWELERTIGSPESESITERVTALAFHPDGKLLALGCGAPSRSGFVKVFAVETGELHRDFGKLHADTVLGLDFSPDGKTLASASADTTIKLLDLKTADTKLPNIKPTDSAPGTTIRTIEGHTGHVLSIAWNDDATTIASGSADQSVRVADSATGETSRTVSGFAEEITAIDFVGTTNEAIAACGDREIRLFHAKSGATVRNFDSAGDFIFALSLSPDGQHLFAGGQSGTLRVWKVRDGAAVATWSE